MEHLFRLPGRAEPVPSLGRWWQTPALFATPPGHSPPAGDAGKPPGVDETEVTVAAATARGYTQQPPTIEGSGTVPGSQGLGAARRPLSPSAGGAGPSCRSTDPMSPMLATPEALSGLEGGGAKVAGEEGRGEAHRLNAAPSCVLGRLPTSPSTPSPALGALFVMSEADPTGAAAPAYAYEVLASFGLDNMGLATNATQVPISSNDIGTIFAHFGVRGKKRKAKTQTAKPAIRRLPGKRSRVFKRRLYREHQRLYALGPGVLLEELAAATGTLGDITLTDIHDTYDDIFGAASPPVAEVGITPASLPKHCKRFSVEEFLRALKAMAPTVCPWAGWPDRQGAAPGPSGGLAARPVEFSILLDKRGHCHYTLSGPVLRGFKARGKPVLGRRSDSLLIGVGLV
ncbi:hypothetical protein MTO96_051220 [Rhipicephalus appendiculatus]